MEDVTVVFYRVNPAVGVSRPQLREIEGDALCTRVMPYGVFYATKNFRLKNTWYVLAGSTLELDTDALTITAYVSAHGATPVAYTKDELNALAGKQAK